MRNARPLSLKRPAFWSIWQALCALGAFVLLSSCAAPAPKAGERPSPSHQPTQTATALPLGVGADEALKLCARSASGNVCLSPAQVHEFYDLNPLYTRGFDGKGTTIVILVPLGSPTIQNDVHVFDQTFALPDPPHLEVLKPPLTLVSNPATNDFFDWAGETTLDVEWAHAIAPGANIVVLVSPVHETEGVQGFPELEQLSRYALDHHLGQVFSQSFGASEPTLLGNPCNQNLGSGEDLVQDYDQNVYQRAVQEHVTILAGSGDEGPTNVDCSEHTTYSYANVLWPASDPLVTAVGGTDMFPQGQTGKYGSEQVWNDGRASGGGLSLLFKEPDWQKNLPTQSRLNGSRAIPDVSWGAQAVFPIYHSYPGASAGWSAGGGTSAAAPQWAGLIALADQMAGQPLGFLNPALYKLAGKGFHDITKGSTSLHSVTGFRAGQGWDMATGWGTPDAAILLPLLIATVQQINDATSP